MRSASLSVVVGIAVATASVAPRASALVVPAASAEDRRHLARGNVLLDAGEAHQNAGAHAEAARAYAKAFDAFARRRKSDAKEKHAMSLAVDEFKAAQEEEPESLALLEEEAALLERFVARTKDDAVLLEERLRVKERIEALEIERAKPKERKLVPSASAEVERRPRREAAAVVASGVVGVVGGAALVGVGAWTFGAADEQRDAQLAALAADTYPNEDGIRDDLDQWHRRGRGIGTGLVVSGAVLAAAGIGLTVWGGMKLRRAGRGPSPRASMVQPMVGTEGVGMAARVVF